MREDGRKSEGNRTAGHDRNIAEQTHVSIRRTRIPIYERDGQVVCMGWRVDLDSDGIRGAGPDESGDIKFVGAPHPRRRARIRQFMAIEPDIRPIVNSPKTQPDDFSPKPGARVNSVRYHQGTANRLVGSMGNSA